MKKNKENKMKLRNKLAIFLVAVLITFVGFSLIASSSVDMLKMGKKAGYEIISNVLANEANAAASQSSSV
jgi:predicted exporter